MKYRFKNPILNQIVSNSSMIIGIFIVVPIVVLAILAPVIAPHNPNQTFDGEYLLPPSKSHFFGTDNFGMDIFSRVLYAPRTDLMIAFFATLIGMIFGIPLGLYVGYYENNKSISGIMSIIIMRIMDVIQAFPVFILGLAIVTATGQKISNVIYVLAFLWTPVFTRLVRTEVLSVRENLYIEQAKAVGNTDSKILFKHVLPNVISPAITQISVCIAASILLTAGLSFVGAGVRMPTPELGLMISVGAKNMVTGQWWPSVFPGVVLCITIFGLSMLGEGISETLDPRNWR